MSREKKSFFERLTGAIKMDDEQPQTGNTHMQSEPITISHMQPGNKNQKMQRETIPPPQQHSDWGGEGDGQLTVDVYQTADDIVIRTMVAGVKPEDLEVNISRDLVTIKGTREHVVEDGSDYFHQELYWGSFSRTIMLPEEVDIEGAEAVEKYGMLTLRLPKMDKNRQTRVRVKSQV